MSGPTRLGVAIATLIGVWIVAFWVTPSAPRGPKVTFGSAPGQPDDAAIDVVEPIMPVIDETSGTAPMDEQVADPTAQPASGAAAAADVEPPSFFLYVLASGDTPEAISLRFYETDAHWSAIARANPEIDFGKPLPIGRVIRVPVDPGNVQGRAAGDEDAPGREPTGDFLYTVQNNDTLGAIAIRFYGDVDKWPLIRNANPGKINRDGTNIKPGMRIIIPKP